MTDEPRAIQVGAIRLLLLVAVGCCGCYASHGGDDDQDAVADARRDGVDDARPPGDGSGDGGEVVERPDCASCEGLWDGAGRPAPDACPMQCTGGCDGLLCRIDCSVDGHCQDDPLDCPSGMDCLVDCGNSACQEAVVTFAPDGAGEVRCWGVASCTAMRVNCPAAAPCTLVCSGESSCQGSNTYCGGGACVTRCEAYATYARVHCASACCCVNNCPPWH